MDVQTQTKRTGFIASLLRLKISSWPSQDAQTSDERLFTNLRTDIASRPVLNLLDGNSCTWWMSCAQGRQRRATARASWYPAGSADGNSVKLESRGDRSFKDLALPVHCLRARLTSRFAELASGA